MTEVGVVLVTHFNIKCCIMSLFGSAECHVFGLGGCGV